MSAGYEVQTVRIATRWLEEGSQEAGASAAELEGIASRLGIGFFNAGATSSLQRVKDGSISRLVQGTHFTSCSFLWQQVWYHTSAACVRGFRLLHVFILSVSPMSTLKASSHCSATSMLVCKPGSTVRVHATAVAEALRHKLALSCRERLCWQV